MIKNKKLEKAIEIGVKRLKSSLYEKECEIRAKLIELRENELLIKQKESNLAESLRILEQEKRNNEYLKIVNIKTEKLFHSAIDSLKSKENLLYKGLNSIISEFNIENSNSENELDIESKIEMIKLFIRKLRDDDNNILESLKKQQLELFNQRNLNCKCGYPLIDLNDNNNNNNKENITNPLNEPRIVELEFRFLELDWERRAIDHTKETLRLEKLRQEEIFISKEKELKQKAQELEIRLKEVKRMEQILKKRMNNKTTTNSNNFENDISSPYNQTPNYSNNLLNNKHCDLNYQYNIQDSNYINSPYSKIIETSPKQNLNLNSDSNSNSNSHHRYYSHSNLDYTSNININENDHTNNICNIDNSSSLMTTPINDHRNSNSNSDKLIPPRMSPLLRSQRQRLKNYLYDDENLENHINNENIIENLPTNL